MSSLRNVLNIRLAASWLFVTVALTVPLTAMADHQYPEEGTCPKRGGIIKHGDMSWRHLDPTAKATPDGIIKYVYDSLIDMTWDLKFRPGLAVSWEQENDRTFVFNLRRGVTFHDGTDFNAEAVKFAMDRLMASGDRLPSPSPYTGIWRKWLHKLEVVQPYKVRMAFKRPWPDYQWYIASTFFIASPTAVKKYGEDYGTKGFAGTGPFMVKLFKPKDRVEVVRNPHYYRQGEPCVDGVHAIAIPSGSVRLLSLRRGELTNVFTFPESQMPMIENAPNIVIHEGEASTLTVLVVNTSLDKFRDQKVRRALQYAVDGKEIIDKVYRGRGAMIRSLLPPWHFGYRGLKDESIIRPNREKARQLLKEAGYGPDKPLQVDLQTYSAPAHVERSVVLQNQFKAVGIKTNVRNLPSGTVQSNMFAGKFDLVLFQIRGGPTLGSYTWDLFSGASGRNPTFYNKPGGYQNPKVEERLSEAVAQLDRDKGAAMMAEVQGVIFEDAPYIYLNWRNHREAWNPDIVKNHHVSLLKNRQDWRRVWLNQ